MAQIDILATLGEDALGNHFTVSIPVIDKLGGVVENLTMRILTIDIPDKTINTYDFTKRGITMARPSGVSEQDKEVSFSFRSDKFFKCYKGIVNWMNYIQNNNTMFMGSDSGANGEGGMSTYRYPITVSAISTLDLGEPNTNWILEGAFPTSIGGVSFDESNGDPIECEVTLTCKNIIYPSI